ncbi:MAG TPA: hypothetical protein VHT04_14300 [Stellaceae bacterium]|nr:hypothetical protein [Stellaceae bacterium]
MLALAACTTVTLKTAELQPADFATGASGIAGSCCYCLSAGHIPPNAFSAGDGQVMVGTDDYFKPGAQPFPCDDLRASNFRAGIRFDLSQFDSIGAATLMFDTVNFVSRVNGETVSSSPPNSVATMNGMATQPFNNQMNADNDVTLPAGSGTLSVGVSSQVHDWVTNAHPNFGFVFWGPRGPIDRKNVPKDNDAMVSWYQNFRLNIVYDPTQNPRAPQ